MKLSPLSGPELLYVVRNMREWDKREIYATQPDNDPLKVVDISMSCATVPGAIAKIASLDRPIAAFGFTPLWPGVYNVWCFATDEFQQIGFPLTKFLKGGIIPAMLEGHFHRAECRSIEGHVEAHEWLSFLGAKREGEPLRDYGRNRETFHVYAWRRCDHEGLRNVYR